MNFNVERFECMNVHIFEIGNLRVRRLSLTKKNKLFLEQKFMLCNLLVTLIIMTEFNFRDEIYRLLPAVKPKEH